MNEANPSVLSQHSIAQVNEPSGSRVMKVDLWGRRRRGRDGDAAQCSTGVDGTGGTGGTGGTNKFRADTTRTSAGLVS